MLTKKDVHKIGQIKLLEVEKRFFQSKGWLLAAMAKARNRAMEIQKVNSRLATKIANIIMLLINEDSGKYTSKYKEITPKADKIKVGRIKRIKSRD